MASSVFPTQVSLQWQGVADDPNGIGVYEYQVSRNGLSLKNVFTPTFVDNTVNASGNYTYQIVAVDQHTNASTATSVQVTTPAAYAVDPHRTGVLPIGSYWGGGGEQIDQSRELAAGGGDRLWIWLAHGDRVSYALLPGLDAGR